MKWNWTPQQKLCVLVEEIYIKERPDCDWHKDILDGFEELGNNTIHIHISNHAFIFKVQGLCVALLVYV